MNMTYEEPHVAKAPAIDMSKFDEGGDRYLVSMVVNYEQVFVNGSEEPTVFAIEPLFGSVRAPTPERAAGLALHLVSLSIDKYKFNVPMAVRLFKGDHYSLPINANPTLVIAL